jgi:cysteine desulfurase
VSEGSYKLYGPKGVGALYVRKSPNVRLEPLAHGGGQEHGFRSGTLNVPGIVGFGAAVEIANREMAADAERIGGLRGRLNEALRAALPYTYLNGPALCEETRGRGEEERGDEDPSDLRVPASPRPRVLLRLPGNLNLSFGGVDGEALMTSLDGLAVSSGSACTTADPEPSYVLRALGRGEALTRASLRFGVGRFNTADEIDRAAEIVTAAVNKLRAR